MINTFPVSLDVSSLTAKKLTGSCALQANVEVRTKKQKMTPTLYLTDEVGSFPRGFTDDQRSRIFHVSTNVQIFGCMLSFIHLAVRPDPRRAAPFICTNTRLALCDRLLLRFKSNTA